MVRFYLFIRVLFFIAFVLGIGSGAALAQNWQATTNTGISGSINSLAIAANGDMFAGTVSNYQPDGVYLSIDNGGTWTAMKSSSETPLGPVYCIDSKGEIFIQGNPNEGEYVSTNEGGSWQAFRIDSSTGSDPAISSFAISIKGDVLVALNGSSMLWEGSYGRGTEWDEQGVDYNNPFVFPTFVVYDPDGYFFAGTSTALYKSNGVTGDAWPESGAISGTPSFGGTVHFAFNSSGLGVNSTIIVAGGTNGLFLSTDNGSQWTTITPPSFSINTTYFALAVGKNGNIFAGLSTGGMFVSTDTGQSWTDISSGLTNGKNEAVNALAISHDSTLYAGTISGVYKYLTSTASAAPSNVTASASSAASSLTLGQNMPNPVSSNTMIRFSVPEAGPVLLRVFDVTGREVAMIANGFYSPGTYNVSFDAHNVVSGVYIYRLEANGQSVARTCVVSP